ncbi:MAG: NAD(P)-binding protein [Phycisphaerales bacterium]|nr:NAD(P)-binding protein [Phycisphaerales bacterium]
MASKKIAVIGAGPAGITCALELKDLGFHDITIFGDFNEAQCRTVQVDGERVA